MLWLKTILVFMIIAFAEVLHGILRTKLLVPKVGSFRSSQIGVFSGSLIIFVIAYFSIRWLAPKDALQALTIGIVWLFLMTSFEIYLVRVVFKMRWEKFLDSLNIFKGGILGLGMIVLLLVPLIASKLRSLF
ncbi:MAG: hypothetical protein WCQ47_02765 [bacterium]